MSSNSRSVSSSVTSPGSWSGSRQASANFLSGDMVLRTTRAAPLPEPHSGVSRASRLQGPSSAIAGKAVAANRVAIARARIAARMVVSLGQAGWTRKPSFSPLPVTALRQPARPQGRPRGPPCEPLTRLNRAALIHHILLLDQFDVVAALD